MSTEFGEARAVVAQRLFVIAAHRGDDTEVLRRHRGKARLTGGDGMRARLHPQALRFIQVAVLLVHDRLDVDRMADRSFVARQLGNGDRGLEAVEGGGQVRVELVGASDPAKQGGRELSVLAAPQ
jgi:hypothetical protein